MDKDRKYAICEDCKKEMKPGNGCLYTHLIIDGKRHKRIKAGDPLDFIPDMSKDETCHDCNVGVGQYHHSNCDAERCPDCHMQLLGCDCNVTHIEMVR